MDRLSAMYADSPESTLPSRPDAEPNDSMERQLQSLAKQHEGYFQTIEDLKTQRGQLVEQIDYTDERIRRFESSINRVKRAMQAISGQDETQTSKPMNGVSANHDR